MLEAVIDTRSLQKGGCQTPTVNRWRVEEIVALFELPSASAISFLSMPSASRWRIPARDAGNGGRG